MFRALGLITLSTLLSFGASSSEGGSGERPAPTTPSKRRASSAAPEVAPEAESTLKAASAAQMGSPSPGAQITPKKPRTKGPIPFYASDDAGSAAAAEASVATAAGEAPSSSGHKPRRSVTADTVAAFSAAAEAPDPAALITSQLSREQLEFLRTEDPGVLVIIHSEALPPSEKAKTLNAEAERDYSNNSYFPFPKTDADITTRHTNWKRWFIRKTIASLLGDAAATASLKAAIEDRKYYRQFIYDMAPEDAPEKGARAEKFYVEQCRIAGIR